MGANAEPLEILVLLKDMTAGAFAKVTGNLTSLEAKANATNLSGFSRAAKSVEKDAETAAGKEAKGGGGIGGMVGALLGIPGPVGVAVAGIGAFIAIGGMAAKTAEETAKQENLLDAAWKAHGSTLEANRDYLNTAIAANENYGQTADSTRAAVLELVQAGHSQADITATMPAILDLAAAKHLDLATAAKQVELAEMGNARALKDLGIVLPKPTAAANELTKATTAATSAHNQLSNAQQALQLMEANLAGKHKTTAADALKLHAAHLKVTAAEQAVTAAETRLTTAQAANAKTGGEQKLVIDGIEGALKGSAGAATDQQKAQAKLSDAWEKFSSVVGPPLQALFSGLLNILAGVVGKIADVITWLGKAGEAVMRSPVGGFIKTVGGFLGGVGNAVGNVGSFLGGLIPRFAAGGAVEPRAGGTLALLGEAGEREYVIPESRMGGGRGGASTIHVHLHLDGREIAQAVEPHLGALFALRGTSARLGSGA